jgi:hypothetical protein
MDDLLAFIDSSVAELAAKAMSDARFSNISESVVAACIMAAALEALGLNPPTGYEDDEAWDPSGRIDTFARLLASLPNEEVDDIVRERDVFVRAAATIDYIHRRSRFRVVENEVSTP